VIATVRSPLRRASGYGSACHDARVSSGPNDPHVVEPGHAPTPYTADEIRRGCPAGRTIRLLVESADGKTFIRTTRFMDCDEHGAIQDRALFSVDGEPLGPVQTDRSSWAELQAHASFPAERTTISEESIDTALGRLDCMRYTVTDGPTVETFWFAKAKAGMPVRFVSEIDGRVTNAVTMIGDE
jgi:hypothetical protein